MRIEFWIPGAPVAQARPRFRHVETRDGRSFGQAYKPKQSVNYETWVRHQAHDAMVAAGAAGVVGSAVALTLRFFLERPRSVSKKKRDKPFVKPDLSNLIKSVEDGMKLAGAWKDDSQICDLDVKKRYADDGFEVGCNVVVEG